MNQDKLNHFLKFIKHHTDSFKIIAHCDNQFDYCGTQKCINCIQYKSKKCSLTIICEDDIIFLKLNYPEYFI